MKKNFILLFIGAFLFQMAFSQVKKNPAVTKAGRPFVPKTKLFALARAGKNEIMLRWAPVDYGTWAAGNQYGFAIEKFTIVKDNKTLSRFERSQPKITIKPRPLANWDSLAINNDYAAVVAQALYGDDFEVTMTEKNKVASLINKTQQNQQRYNMAMYGADHSYEAAQYAGLAYLDKDVKKGEKYFYRIYSLVPGGIRKIDTATIFIGLSDYKPLPKPSDILIQFGDKTAMLLWDFETNKEYYTSYMVERSEDSGKIFTPLSDKPFTTLADSKKGAGAGGISYLDTLTNNEIVYQYRIAGVSLFGDTGPYSNIVAGSGKFLMNTTPGITGVQQNEKGEYLLNWEMEDSLNSKLREFRINQSETIDGVFTVFKQNIPAITRTMKVDSLYGTNYFTVTAISKGGEEKTSLPYLLQPADSIAPAVPTGFSATIDSTGIVHLKWNRNTEKDLDGYRIFKTNVKGHELIPLMDSLFYTNETTDTSNLKSLNTRLYYTIKAVDKRYNQSAFAPMIEVVKPDIIPPSPPVLAGYEVAEDGIKLMWENSADEDVVMHNLYRKTAGSSDDWKLIQSFRDRTIKQLVDKSVEETKTYSYTLIAVDSAKLESQPAIPITILFPEKRIKTAFKSMQVEVDRDNRIISINWIKLPGIKNIKQIELYRGADKLGMSLYQLLGKDLLAFTDKELQVNTKYKYGIRVVFENGKFSDFITKNVIY